MKKILILIAFIFLITPTLVSAAWWNPFSWNIFSRGNEKEMVSAQEEKIRELEAKINELKEPKTTESAVSTSVEDTAPTGTDTVEQPIKILPTVTNNSDKIAEQEAAYAKQKAFEIEQLEIQRINTEIEAQKILQAEVVAAELAKQKQEQDAIKKAADEKDMKLNEINLKIAKLNEKYAKDIAAKKYQPGGYTSARNIELQAITDKYNIDYNLLAAEYQLVLYGN